jgi:hypothetical protein
MPSRARWRKLSLTSPRTRRRGTVAGTQRVFLNNVGGAFGSEEPILYACALPGKNLGGGRKGVRVRCELHLLAMARANGRLRRRYGTALRQIAKWHGTAQLRRGLAQPDEQQAPARSTWAGATVVFSAG